VTEQHAVVSHDEWTDARKALLAKEKEFTRLRDQLSRERRDLPWELVDKVYVFDGPNGKETLSELFDGRSQLIVYHFMFDPEWDEGCKHCSFWADSFDANIVHLNACDVTMVAVSRARAPKLTSYEKRMGWSFHWVSSFDTDFNFDYGVTFTPEEQMTEGTYNYAPHPLIGPEREGVSVFTKDEAGRIFHTYSAYARGIDMVNATYHYLDLVPGGRGEEGQPPQHWVRRRDEYGKD
jgi:predicted dithiol-disulfide oxidoreductase (DUF899 family)